MLTVKTGEERQEIVVEFLKDAKDGRNRFKSGDVASIEASKAKFMIDTGIARRRTSPNGADGKPAAISSPEDSRPDINAFLERMGKATTLNALYETACSIDPEALTPSDLDCLWTSYVKERLRFKGEFLPDTTNT